MEQQVQTLRHLFISDLESYSSQIEKDLRELFIGVSYLEEKDRGRILAFSFEYDPEDFVISFQTLGEAGEVLSDFLYLPTERFEKRFPSNKFVIEDESLEDDLYDRDFQEAEIEDILIEYRREKQAIFSDWFIARWKKVTEELGKTINAFFSKQHSFYKTDLNTLDLIDSDEIQEKILVNKTQN